MYIPLFEISILICLSVITSHSLLLNTEQDIKLSEQFLALNYSNDAVGRQGLNSNCGFSRSFQSLIDNKIVKGRIAKVGEFPWHVLLEIYDSKNSHVQCGGSIINPRWVMTAAHCVSDEQTGEFSVDSLEIVAGTRDLLDQDPTSQRRYADCILLHPKWKGSNGRFKNDIALVRIKSPFEVNSRFGGNVGTVCLPPKTSTEYTGRARVSGWGLTESSGNPSDLLTYTDVDIIDRETCRSYQFPIPITKSMMCQSPDRTAPCNGDSGGALIVTSSQKEPIEFTQIGIVSFGPEKCANGEIPSAIYTKVSHHRDWIDYIIETHDNSDQCDIDLKNLPETQK